MILSRRDARPKLWDRKNTRNWGSAFRCEAGADLVKGRQRGSPMARSVEPFQELNLTRVINIVEGDSHDQVQVT